jgi:hypothetical protein
VIFNFLPDRTRKGNVACVQTENSFAKLTPLRFCRYLGHNDARLVASGILKRNVQVATSTFAQDANSRF